jgi:formylglycine-generating enzyme required for sulfatase activity
MSTIFLSHSSKDNGWAERIQDWLQGSEHKQQPQLRYHSTFLDFDPEQGIPLGRSWRDTLYEQLQLCRAVIVLCSQSYNESIWCQAELAIAIHSRKLLLPVRIDASPLPKLLTETQATQLEAIPLDSQTAEGWQRLERGLQSLRWQDRLAWPPDDDPDASPFPGLYCLDRRHAPVFFGQDAKLREVQDKLEQLTATASRLLLILGASGCGKSSLLRAGVLPWLADGSEEPWIVLDPFRPEDDPFAALAAAVSSAYSSLGLDPPATPASSADELQDQLQDLRLQAQRQEARVVIAVDQFEELLGHGSSDGSRTSSADAFLALLVELLASDHNRLVILATLRSDFLNSFQRHPSGLGAAAGAADPVLLGPMDQAGFRQVIEGPAERVGLELETGLSDQLVKDTATGDALPLLAFTLSRLWQERPPSGGWTREQYDELGRLDGALRKRADRVLATWATNPQDRSALREVFLDHLVRLSDDGLVARRAARWGELPARSLAIVERFVEERLLVAGGGDGNDRVEIAHEALLRTWPTLVAWIGEGRLELEQRRRVERLCAELDPARQSQAKARRDSLAQLAWMASLGGGTCQVRAVRKVAPAELEHQLANPEVPEAERADAILVLALIGAEAPLQRLLADPAAPPGLRRRAAEGLGLLARSCGDGDQHQRIVVELERWLRSDSLDLTIQTLPDPQELAEARRLSQEQVIQELAQAREAGHLDNTSAEDLLAVMDKAVAEGERQFLLEQVRAAGWDEHDAHLPLLQGASRGLQLALAVDLPLANSGPGRPMPMLTLMALEDNGELRIRSTVVEVPVWRLPLPGGDQLELVAVPAGDYTIGSPPEEPGRAIYPEFRERCVDVDVEALRRVRLASFGVVRYSISQAQWRAVVEGTPGQGLEANPGKAHPLGLWEQYGLPDAMAVDSVTWNDCQEWLRRLNLWLQQQWRALSGVGEVPSLALPSESQWEVACRAGTSTPFHFGDTLDGAWVGYDASETIGLGRLGRGSNAKQPDLNGAYGLVNAWGLAEMHGQLAEWCGDRWQRNPLEARTEAGLAWQGFDPGLAGSSHQNHRVLRGGSVFYGPDYCRSAFRNGAHPASSDTDFGLRPFCTSPIGTAAPPIAPAAAAPGPNQSDPSETGN